MTIGTAECELVSALMAVFRIWGILSLAIGAENVGHGISPRGGVVDVIKEVPCARSADSDAFD